MKLWIRVLIGILLGAIFAGALESGIWYLLLVNFHTATGLFNEMMIPLGTILGAAYGVIGGGISGAIIAWKDLGVVKSLLLAGTINLSVVAIAFSTSSPVEFEIWLCIFCAFPIGVITGILVSAINRKLSAPADPLDNSQ